MNKKRTFGVHSLYMLQEHTARRLEAIGRLGFINPFGDERRTNPFVGEKKPKGRWV